jgi:hypothetical protein
MVYQKTQKMSRSFFGGRRRPSPSCGLLTRHIAHSHTEREGVTRQPIRTVFTSRTFTCSIETLQGRFTAIVNPTASLDIVGRWPDF